MGREKGNGIGKGMGELLVVPALADIVCVWVDSVRLFRD